MTVENKKNTEKKEILDRNQGNFSIFLFAYILLFKVCKAGGVKMLETTEEDGFKYFGKIVDLCKECYPLEFKVNGISGF